MRLHGWTEWECTIISEPLTSLPGSILPNSKSLSPCHQKSGLENNSSRSEDKSGQISSLLKSLQWFLASNSGSPSTPMRPFMCARINCLHLILWGHSDLLFCVKGTGHFSFKGSIPVNVVKALVSHKVSKEIFLPSKVPPSFHLE